MSAFSLTKVATDLIAALGYGGLSVGLIIDSAGIPIPSEVLLPLAGTLARQGHFNLAAVIIIGTLAQVIGAALSYWIGASGGIGLVQRYGKYVFFREQELAKTEVVFAKHGRWIALIGRCIPVIRGYVGYPAGLSRMPFGQFLFYSAVGAAIWSVFLAYLGYWLGGQLAAIDALSSKFNLVIIALLLLGAIWYVRRHRRRNA